MPPKFTTDGYMEPMKPRPLGAALGIMVALVALPLAWFATWCIGLPLFFIGALMVANEKGQRRYRVTRTKLLIEDEPLIRGFVIGPIRNRIPWGEVSSVEHTGSSVKILTADGRELLLGEGGTEQELAKFFNRIELAREN